LYRYIADVTSGDYNEYVLAYFTAKMPFTTPLPKYPFSKTEASLIGEWNPQGVSVGEDDTAFLHNENLDVSIAIKDWWTNTTEGVEMTLAGEGKIMVPNKVRGCDVHSNTDVGAVMDDNAICAQYYYVNMTVTHASVVNLWKKNLPSEIIAPRGEENALGMSTTETSSINSDGVQAYKIVLFLDIEVGRCTLTSPDLPLTGAYNLPGFNPCHLSSEKTV
jgi:hypothetical protein